MTQHQIRQSTLINLRTAVEKVITNVSQRLDEPLTLEGMAKMAYMSPFHFNRKFHQITGIPPVQFLYALRLQAAKHLLLKTQMSITDICFEVGYTSLGTFTSRFTKLVGLSPREYRKLAKKMHLFDWERLYCEEWKSPNQSPIEPFLKGRINAPPNFEGLIFIGLFNQMIPQNLPLAGTIITRSGPFFIDSLVEGEFYLLVAALPRTDNVMEYLLPDFSKLLVGVCETPLYIRSNYNKDNVEVNLRPVQTIDPPILSALPYLLTSGMAKFLSVPDR